MPYDESDDYDVYEIIDQAYNEADRMSRPIHLLLETYQKYEEHDPDADRVADDSEALEWLDDYWEYVKWNEHGNESSIDEVGGFKGFARTVTDSDYVDATLNYLIYDDDPEQIDPTARDLADRLKNIANRYGALRKMKKNRHQLAKSGDWIQDWVNGKVEMNSFEANGVSFSLDMSSGGGAYSNDEDLIYQGKEILVYMGLPFDTDFESEGDEIIYISAYDENMTELWTNAYSIYQVPTFAHAIGKLENILRYNNIEAKASKSTKKSQDIHSMIADIRKNNNSLKKTRVDISIGKNFYDNPYQDAEDDFQKEMASLGRILSNSGIDYNLKDIDVSDGYGYEIVFHNFDDGKKVFNEVANWGDAHGFYTWLKDEGIITLTPN